MDRRANRILEFIFVLASVACGPFGKSTPDKTGGGDPGKTTAFTGLEGAVDAFDRGDYQKAMDLTQIILGENSGDEAAAIIQGYSYLGLAGLRVFRVAPCLSSGGLSCDSPGAGPSIGGPFESWLRTDETGARQADAVDAAHLLKRLQVALLKPSISDIALMKRDNFNSSSGIFLGNREVVIPAKRIPVNHAAVLKSITAAIKSVCHLLPSDAPARQISEIYEIPECQSRGASPREPEKIGYLLALSHLSHALAYTSVILYKNDTCDTHPYDWCELESGEEFLFALERASKEIASRPSRSLDRLIAEAADFTKAVHAIFTTAGGPSFLAETLDELSATVAALGHIKGLPTVVSADISRVLEKVGHYGSLADSPDGALGAFRYVMLDSTISPVIEKVATVAADTVAKGGAVGGPVIDVGDLSTLQPADSDGAKKLCLIYNDLLKIYPRAKMPERRVVGC